MICAIFTGRMPEAHQAQAGEYYQTLLPHLHNISGFISETFYTSVRSGDWLLLSFWESYDAVKRWRELEVHQEIMQKSRREMWERHDIRLGPVIDGVIALNLDEGLVDRTTNVGKSKVYYLMELEREGGEPMTLQTLASRLDIDISAESLEGSAEWELFESDPTTTKALLMTGWKSHTAAAQFSSEHPASADCRVWRMENKREYTMVNRQEAPQP